MLKTNCTYPSISFLNRDFSNFVPDVLCSDLIEDKYYFPRLRNEKGGKCFLTYSREPDCETAWRVVRVIVYQAYCFVASEQLDKNNDESLYRHM